MHYTLCDMFSDLTQNAFEAGAKLITVVFAESEKKLSVTITDSGKGMTKEHLSRATDPFYTDGIKHPKRKVGLGIPFLIQTAESTGGSWKIVSETGDEDGKKPGTIVECSFDLTNIDTPPVGDVCGYFHQIMTFDGNYEMIIKRSKTLLDYTLTRSELLEALGLNETGRFEDANALSLLRQYLEECETIN